MRYVIFSVVIMILAASVARAGEAIKIIREDGSVAVFDLGTEMKQERAAPSPSLEKTVEKESPPGKSLEEKSPVKKVSAKTPAKKSLAKKAPVERAAAKMPRARPAAPVAAPVQETQRVIPPGTVITEDLARSIAFDRAPPEPARAVQVVQRTYKDKLVFVVTFRTESGAHDVLVDAQSGDVVAVN